LTLALLVSPAASPGAAGAESGAREVLKEVARAYQALPAYADHGEFVMTVRLGGTTHATRTSASLTLARPNKLRVDAGGAVLVSDGTTLTTVVAASKKYASEPAPKLVTFQTVAGGPVGSLLFGGPGGPPLLMVAGLLLGDEPARAVLDQGETLELEDDREFEGQSCRVVRVESPAGTVYRLLIDPQTKLLRAVDVAPDPKALAALFPADAKVSVDSYRWVAGAVSTNAPAADAFAAELPKDFAKLGALALDDKNGKDDASKFRVQKLVDKPAPGFALTVLDGSGKTKTLAKADLAGKVVMIDFWATWCAPCLAELPEVQKLVASYAKAKKDVVIVALSQDNEPKDPVEVRKLIEKTLKAKGIDLEMPPVGLVGLDPSNAVGDSFEVEGYPTVVILDGKGVVRSAHVGYREDVGKSLAREIDALLEGKPLPDKAEAAK
jgi:thiol-disulfide isomerase/thioredoxin